MRIYYKTNPTGSVCITPCTNNPPTKNTKVGSAECEECPHFKDISYPESWVDCAMENETRVETAEMKFIRDDKGARHFSLPNSGDHADEMSVEELHEYLVCYGYIKPDPLQKAMTAVDAAKEKWITEDWYGATNLLTDVKDIIRTLYEEATNG